MNDTISFQSLRLLYYRFKETTYYPLTLAGVIFVIGVILLIQVVIPQISQWFSVRREIETTQGRIKNIRDNTAFLSSQNQEALESDVETTALALPFEKDYAGIINALTTTASRTSIPLSDYTLNVGDVADALPESQVGQIAIEVALATDLQGAKRFIDELSKSLPISAVSNVSYGQTGVVAKIEFAYRGFPKIALDGSQKLSSLSPQERDLLQTLASWKAPSSSSFIEDTGAASDSGSFSSPL